MNKDNFYAKRFGTRLKVEREKRGITQSDLSKITGLTQPVIARLESGKIKTPRMSTLQPIYDALGLSEAEIKSLTSDMAYEVTSDEEKTNINISIPHLLKLNKTDASRKFNNYINAISDEDFYLIAFAAEAIFNSEHPEESNRSFKNFANNAQDGEVFENAQIINNRIEDVDYYQGLEFIEKIKKQGLYTINTRKNEFYNPITVSHEVKFDNNMRIGCDLIKNSLELGNSINLLVVGEHGSGKDTLIKSLAYLTDLSYWDYECNSNTSFHDLLIETIQDENGIQEVESPLFMGFKYGGIVHIKNYNNIRNSDTLNLFKAAYSDLGIIKLNDEVIKRHKQCIFIFDEESDLGEGGEKPMKKSFKNKMNMTFKLKLPNNQTLVTQLVSKYHMHNIYAFKLVSCFNQIRDYLCNEGEVYTQFSVDELYKWGKYIVEKNYELIIPEQLFKKIFDDSDLYNDIVDLVNLYLS